ncbi:hypothetical protein V1478_000318 [Vespula squamosa]|uniref:Reverse transcriptase Ty1/copia-type domain-containing protein n=1 Tax=Vespula squamosa TaxID=30214 RepID=A0ABD2C565_VESSQ
MEELTGFENRTFIDTTDISIANIKIEESETGLSLSQKEYMNKILIKYNLKDCNSAKTSMSLQQSSTIMKIHDS